MNFSDGVTSLFNGLANNRNALRGNEVTNTRITNQQLSEVYKSGLGNKVARIKTGYALKINNILFTNETDKDYYTAKLQAKVKEAFLWSVVFGRGILVINDGADLATPLTKVDKDGVQFEVFSGDMVSVIEYERDLNSKRYLKPTWYSVNGFNFHYSRVIDFTYVRPTQFDAPTYNYGGISEFELIYDQIISDGVVERASVSMLEKSASLFYKVKDLKNAIQRKQEGNLVKFFSLAEDRRSIYGAGLIDSEDDVMNVTQSLTNLRDADDISLRRVAMVSGIPLPMLIGENVKGLNASGEQEKTSFNEMIELLQQDFVLPKLNKLLQILGLAPVSFMENQNLSPLDKVEYETKVIDNAIKLLNLGYNVDTYVIDRGLKLDKGAIRAGEEVIDE